MQCAQWARSRALNEFHRGFEENHPVLLTQTKQNKGIEFIWCNLAGSILLGKCIYNSKDKTTSCSLWLQQGGMNRWTLSIPIWSSFSIRFGFHFIFLSWRRGIALIGFVRKRNKDLYSIKNRWDKTAKCGTSSECDNKSFPSGFVILFLAALLICASLRWTTSQSSNEDGLQENMGRLIDAQH